MTDVDALKDCLNTIEKIPDHKIVIVPGGGVFADQVRKVQHQWKFDDQTAHNMAILAMQQMALLFKSLNTTFQMAENVSAIQQAWLAHSIVIWSPEIKQFDASTVKASWDVSSDSLAAWLAGQLNVKELVVVKSVKIPLGIDILTMQKKGILDMAFADFVENSAYKVTVINKHRFNENYE